MKTQIQNPRAEPRQAGPARAVLLVQPARFGHNDQTAASNRFQQPSRTPAAQHARAELDALGSALRDAGVRVCIAEDSAAPPKPDAVFPNNWVSWHRDGTTVLYPMHAPNRRAERRMQVVRAAELQSGFRRRRLLDLSVYEQQGRYLEGTGSLVLDHRHGQVYACRSVRTDEGLVREWARLMGYEPVVFDASGSDGTPLYHTNVMLAIGTRWCVVCAPAIAPADRVRVLQRLHGGEREVIEIDRAAMQAFAGNLLELESAAGGARGEGKGEGAGRVGARTLLVMSACARAALSADAPAWERLRGSVDALIAVAVPTIESVGGGSVRCMMAEIPAVAA
ncbi:MAG TPA: arginine deiminase-related protein [Steroidobacteraceae bacterium]|jgi:hypothetical protein|nr:arginine deiminase-related protein [Steroidobacteraceae bacterium]